MPRNIMLQVRKRCEASSKHTAMAVPAQAHAALRQLEESIRQHTTAEASALARVAVCVLRHNPGIRADSTGVADYSQSDRLVMQSVVRLAEKELGAVRNPQIELARPQVSVAALMATEHTKIDRELRMPGSCFCARVASGAATVDDGGFVVLEDEFGDGVIARCQERGDPATASQEVRAFSPGPLLSSAVATQAGTRAF